MANSARRLAQNLQEIIKNDLRWLWQGNQADESSLFCPILRKAENRRNVCRAMWPRIKQAEFQPFCVRAVEMHLSLNLPVI